MSGGLRDGLAALAGEVKMVDMNKRVLRGSRRITMRNRVVAGVAAVAALSGGAVAVAAVRPTPTPTPPASESPVPSESPSPTPSLSPELPDVDIRNSTFEVPAFPGDRRCPAGNRAFKDGKVVVGREDADRVQLLMSEPFKGDIDGQPGEEILVELHCDGYTSSGQVLAVKVAPDGRPTTLGFVLISPDHPHFEIIDRSPRIQDGTVLVDVLGPSRGDGPMGVQDLQTRGYAYRNGRFEQVSGPIRFALPPGSYRQVDLRNVTALIHVPGNPPSQGFVRLSNGQGSTTVNKVAYEVTVLSSTFFTEFRGSAMLYRLKAADGSTRTIVNIYQMPVAILGAYVASIKDGTNLRGATKVEASGQQLKVTIDGRVVTYVQSSDGSWVSSA